MRPDAQVVADELIKIGIKMEVPAPGLFQFDIAGVKYIFNHEGTLKYTIEYKLNTDTFQEFYYDGHDRLKTNWNGHDRLKTNWNGQLPAPEIDVKKFGP
jgi:hypothetical protein